MVMVHPEDNHWQYPSLWDKKSYKYGMIKIGSKLGKFKNNDFWKEIAKISFLGYIVGDLKSNVVEILRFDGVKMIMQKGNIVNNLLTVEMADNVATILLQIAITNRKNLISQSKEKLNPLGKNKLIFQFAKARGNTIFWIRNKYPKVTINNIIDCTQEHIDYMKWKKSMKNIN